MKKIPVFIVTIIISLSGYSQFYLKAGGSFNYTLGNEIFTSNYSIDYNPGFGKIVEHNTNVRSSLAKGLMGNIVLGYDHNKYISTELGLSYLKGGQTIAKDITHYYEGDDIATIITKGSLFSISPTLIFSYEVQGVRPYLSIGIPINFISFEDKYNFSTYDNRISIQAATEYSGGPSIGFSTKLGLLVHINSKLSIFGEASFTYATFSPDKDVTSELLIDGVDSLSSLTISERESEYVDDLTTFLEYDDESEEWVESFDTNQPKKRRKFDVPASYLSFTLGLRLNLFNRRNKE